MFVLNPFKAMWVLGIICLFVCFCDPSKQSPIFLRGTYNTAPYFVMIIVCFFADFILLVFVKSDGFFVIEEESRPRQFNPKYIWMNKSHQPRTFEHSTLRLSTKKYPSKKNTWLYFSLRQSSEQESRAALHQPIWAEGWFGGGNLPANKNKQIQPRTGQESNVKQQHVEKPHTQSDLTRRVCLAFWVLCFVFFCCW